MIRTRGLAYRYGAGPLLNFADVDVTQGGTLLVRGRSGSGKSTWLALVAGLRGATGGDLLVGGIHIGPQRAAELDAWRARCIGFVPQKLHLSSALTVADNLALAYFAAGRKRDDAAIAQALDQLGVGELAHRKPHQLSGGQAQRVALARAVLLQPELLLADEPTASLDDEAAAVALSLLQSSAARCGASLVIATHDQRVVQALAAVPRLQTLDLNAGRAAGQAMPNLNEMPTLGATDKRWQL